jgi:LysM repeat protein
MQPFGAFRFCSSEYLNTGRGMRAGCSNNYVVVSGDTLSDIAASHGTTVAAILAANPAITDPNQIDVGQNICLDGDTYAPSKSPACLLA